MDSAIIEIISVLILAIVLRQLVFTIVHVEGISMSDTLFTGDLLFATKLDLLFGKPRRGRVVICRYPGSRKNFVKRLVGMPGDTIEIRMGITYLNGRPLDEGYISHPAWRKLAPVKLGEDEYFVMGDNRSRSRDSRMVGALSRSQIKATVRARIWPIRRMGRIILRSAYAQEKLHGDAECGQS